MFGVDDFALWFSWYFVSNLAQHPAAQRLVEKAESAITETDPGIRADDPDLLLDWLDKPVTPGRKPATKPQITVPPSVMPAAKAIPQAE